MVDINFITRIPISISKVLVIDNLGFGPQLQDFTGRLRIEVEFYKKRLVIFMRFFLGIGWTVLILTFKFFR